jgi:hypothetical protein
MPTTVATSAAAAVTAMSGSRAFGAIKLGTRPMIAGSAVRPVGGAVRPADSSSIHDRLSSVSRKKRKGAVMTIKPLVAAVAGACVLVACSSNSGSTHAAPRSSGAHPSDATHTSGSTQPASSCPLPSFGSGAAYHPQIDPHRFGPNVTNPWYPLQPGTTYRYSGLDEGDPVTDIVVVTNRTHELAGVRTRVVFDRLFKHGKVVERTNDYFAQDSCGNVWYFGEDTAELNAAGKVVNTDGTWHSGVGGAEPGVFMQAHPQVGRKFRQEWLRGQAEDAFRLVETGTTITVPAGQYHDAIRTEETSGLEPGVIDNKWYVKGVGDVRELTVKGPQERLVLVRVTH